MGRTHALLVLSLLVAPGARPPVAETTLWVWHGPHDLRGLGASARVAYLARTLRIGPEGLRVLPRRGALELDPGTPRLAVVRIEYVPGAPAGAFAREAPTLLEAIAPVFEEDAAGLQIDFDAPLSARGAYEALLGKLRERLPRNWTLEMTALGSWCLQDRWLARAPVDRVVPMLFGPGHARDETWAALGRGPLPEPRCRASQGLWEGEVPPRVPEQLYVFPRARWTLPRAERALRAGS